MASAGREKGYYAYKETAMDDTDNRAWYAAFKAKDARFDGRFFVGVSSTGIYCRPVCRARLPKATNCTFYKTAAEAERAGFRPCLLCRPERAPGVAGMDAYGAVIVDMPGAAPLDAPGVAGMDAPDVAPVDASGVAPVDATVSLARKAARLLEEHCGNGHPLKEIVRRLGCSDRHLRRAFAAEYKVSPVQYLQTCRLLLAKNLLTDTLLSITDVAMAAGFGSLRRFNGLFKKQYGLAPTALRRQAGSAQVIGNRASDAKASGNRAGDNNVTLLLGYRPPYLWERMLDFLARRAIPGVETVVSREYARTVRFTNADKDVPGWVRVTHRPSKNALAVSLDAALLPVLPQVLAGMSHLFDVRCDPSAVYETLAAMNSIKPGLCVPGTRLPGCADPFEMAVRAVLGQQITIKAARTLAGRLAERYGTPIDTGFDGLTRTFPSPGVIIALEGPIADHLGPLGITGSRARAIAGLAQAFASGELDFARCEPPETQMRTLMTIPGIGPWTAQYIAMRAMAWPDAFPHTDYGVIKALAPLSGGEIVKTAEAWRPWRSYATINLWNSL